MQFHEFANLFPMMSDQEHSALVEDMKTNGYEKAFPIWTYEGKILDGRNRYRAARAAGVEPVFKEYQGDDPLRFVISGNLNRRHLSESQRAMVGAKLANMSEGRPKNNSANLRSYDSDLISRDKAATLLNISARSIDTAKAIERNAPALVVQIERGEMTLNQAYREVKSAQKREELEQAARQVPARKTRTWEILCGDVLEELDKLESDTVDLIVTDPPYNIGIDYGEGAEADRMSDNCYVSWVDEWINECVRVLSPTGSMWVVINDEYAADYYLTLRASRMTRRAWVKWYETFGVCNSSGSNFSRTSRHLLYFSKSPRQFTWNLEAVTRPSDRQTKYGDSRANPGGKVMDDVWQVPRLVGTSTERMPDFPTQLPMDLIRPIVGACSNPGDLVVDPFNGSGTTGAVCVELGRRYLGIEKSATFADLARKRLLAMEAK